MKEKNNKKEKNNNKNHDTSILNSHSKKYNLIWMDEYKMMREELVNYMEKLQAVRNMMYITIGAVFTFSISKNLPFFCVLLPIFFILPAYITAIDYWVCVRKASAYLVVFHESYKDCPIHWESRHNMLKKMNNKKENFKKSIGMIWPGCYTSYRYVESLYKSPRRFLYYLSQRIEKAIDEELDILDMARMSDRELRNRMMEIAMQEYGSRDIGSLGYGQKLSVARIVRRMYGVPFKQMSRITGLRAEVLKDYV